MDFTHRKYRELCEAILKSRYKNITVADFISMSNVELNNYLLILRHDVDRSPKKALEMAKIEEGYGITASYYFRIPISYNEEIIKGIAKMGHEIGLHYECLDESQGDIDAAGEILRKELSIIRSLTEVVTTSMHGNPLTKFNNLDIWKQFRLDQYDLLGEAYLSMDFEKVMYYSDTGRMWEDGKFNIKDTIPYGMETVRDKPILVTTDDLMRLIKHDDRNVYLLIHPSRWSGSRRDFLFSYASDVVVNLGKSIYSKFLRAKNEGCFSHERG